MRFNHPLQFLALTVAVVCCLSTTPSRAQSWLMVSLDGENRIVVYDRNEQTGELSDPVSSTTSGSPGSLLFDSKRKVLFAALRSSEQVASYRFDATGRLTMMSEIKVEPDPAYVSLDKSGRWLFSASYAAGKVAVHSIDDKGAIGSKVKWYPTADKAHAALTDPTNRWLVVPHTGPNQVHMLAFDAENGTLTPSEPAFYETPPNTGPRHAVFHPQHPIMYTVHEQGGSVTVWRVDRTKGTLTALDSYPTLPADYNEKFACADLELTPNSKWLIASTRGHDSLACFKVADDGASLTQASRTPTEGTPRQFSVSPDGRYLYSAGQSTGRIAVFRIDDDTGKLSKVSTTEVGKRPWWVITLDSKG